MHLRLYQLRICISKKIPTPKGDTDNGGEPLSGTYSAASFTCPRCTGLYCALWHTGKTCLSRYKPIFCAHYSCLTLCRNRRRLCRWLEAAQQLCFWCRYGLRDDSTRATQGADRPGGERDWRVGSYRDPDSQSGLRLHGSRHRHTSEQPLVASLCR